MRTNEIGGLTDGVDAWVSHACCDDLQVQTAFRSFDERELNRDVVAGADVDFGRVAVVEVREGGHHSDGRIERHCEAVRVVAVVAHFKRHGLRQVARNVRLPRFFVGNEDRRRFKNLDDQFNRVHDRSIVNAGGGDGYRIVARAEANGHGQLHDDGGFTIPSVQNRGLVCR